MADLRIESTEHNEEVYTTNISQNRGSRCIFHNSNGHTTEMCRNYLSMRDDEKVNFVKEKQACWSCLKIGHRYNQCRYKKKC